MGKSLISLSLFSALIVLSVLWKTTLADDKCSLGCKGTPSGSTFLNGHKYNYAVEGEVSIYLSGGDKQETGVKLLGQVTVSALGNCAHVLKVQNLVISGPGGKKYPKPPGLEKAVRFTLQDGHLGSDICTEEGDTRRSLNIKRAIISLLQSGQKSGNEIDVFGACPTEASSSQEGGAVLVHRSRDLSRCGFREHGKNDLITAVYNPQAEIKNSQVLQSSLNVESKLNNGVPEKISATEEHLYKPFSVGENGARAKVHTKMTLTGQSGGADNGQFSDHRSIIFDAPHGEQANSNNLQSAVTAVKDAAKNLAKEANSKSAKTFSLVIMVFRSTDKDNLLKVYSQVKGNSLERRVFLDALLRTGTAASISASIQLLKTKELSQLEETLVYLSLGNARHVDDEALKAVTSLLDIPHIPKEIYLGVGALASAYCRAHDCHSGSSEGVATLTQKLASKLNCKAKGKVEQDQTVAVLKGIRNIRHLEDSVIDKLVHCAQDNSVKARVRVAALEAYHADPCSAKIKKSALDILKNHQLDSELRIKAYLVVIDCPCGKSANEIKTLLDSEPVHQVGRFITSSLRHIRASTNPDKHHARQHYGQITTPKKFNLDDRKYSFYREVSYSIDALGLGGNVEQTVIYSQDSFLPRSASLNLTAEVFGHSLNVFEVGARQGNLDRVIEHFLGPKSFLRTEDPQKLYDDLVKRVQEVDKKVESKIRGRRSVKTDIDSFDKHVKAESTPYDNELDMDIYLKLFGTDAVFLSLGDDKGFDYNSLLDQILKYLDSGLNQAKRFQKELRAHVLFLDAELSYATSTGLPLKLKLLGTATGRLDIATHIDIRQIIRDPKNAKLDIKLIPSTDVEVTCAFLVDADSIMTGLSVSSNLHSSTGGHVIAKVLENGQGFDLQLGLPVDKQEIVTASSELLFVTAEKGEKAEFIPVKTDVDKKEYSGCFDQLAGVLGLTLCGEVQVPFSVSGQEAQASLQKFFTRFPLTGGAKLKLLLEKNDLKGYHVKGLLRRQNNKNTFELLFEAEGSKNRKTSISGELINTQEEKTISLALESPIKVLSGQVSLYTKPNEYAAVIKAKMDAEEYFGRAGFGVQGNEKRSVFTPVVEYQLPGGQGKKSLKIDGQVVREISGPVTKYSLEGIKVSYPKSGVVDINGHVSIEGRNFDSDIKAKTAEHNMILSASLKGHDGKVEFQNTLNPHINFKVVAHSEYEEKNVRNDIDVYYGADLKNPQNRVTFNQLLKYHKKSAEDFGLITKNKFLIHALPLLIKIDAEVDPKKVDVELEGQYVNDKFDFDLEARTEIKKPGDYSVKVVAHCNKNGIEAFAKRDIVSADKSNFENYITIKGVGKYELSGVVLHKTKPNDLNVGVVGHLKVSGGNKNEDIKFDVGAIENNNLYSSHAKISRGKGDLVDFLLKINRGSNPNGQLKLILKDAISANGQFKVTDNDGKGNGMLIIDFKNAQRKIKGDLKFVVKDPVYNADVDLFLNFEKDNADKIHFSTKSKKTEKLIESKNKVVYGPKKFELNLHKDGIIEKDGKVAADLEVVLPNERVLGFKVNRDVTTKDDTINGHFEAVLSDAEKRGSPASTITYKGKIVNSNFEKDTLNYEGQVLIKLKGGKNLDYIIHVKNTPQGNDKLKYEVKTDVTGNLIPKPASLLFTMDYVDAEKSLIDGQEKYHLKGSYGDDVSFEVVNTGDLKIMEKGDKKIQDDTTVMLRLPIEKAHDIKFVSSILYLLPENNDVVFEYTVSESVQINADVYKVDASGKFGVSAGNTKVKVFVPHVDPFSLDTSYKANLEGDKKTANVDIKSTYGKGKSANLQFAAASTGHEHSLNIKAHAPQAEKLKKLDLSVTTKTPSSDSYSGSVIVDADGRVYKSDVLVVYSKVHPVLDLKYTSPTTGKTSRVYMKGNALSSNQGKLEVKLDNIKDLSLDATSEGSIQKDHVVLKLRANSEKLGLKNYNVDISSKDAGSGKRLEFHATNDNKNVFSGSTSFISKQEGPKTIIEGSGSVKVKDDQKSATFKYIRTLLTEGQEQGVETFMNMAIGERSYVAESRVTNMEYKTSYLYCEEKKQCAHAELNSKLTVPKQGVLEHKVNVIVDLRKLGFAPEFGLESKSSVSQSQLPQYTLDVHVNKEEKRYHLHVYSTPDHGKYPAGITVTLPHRVLALESHLTYPTNNRLPFPLKGDVSLSLDKNKPQLKSAVRYLIDVNGADQQHTVTAEIGFSHPKLGKEAVAKFRGNLQRPTDNSVKVESSATLSHSTIGGDRESKFRFEASPAKFKLYLDTPIVQIVDLDASSTLNENLQEANVKFSLLQGKPVTVKAVAKDFKYFEFTTGYSEDAQRKLSIVGHVDPEKKVDISADIVLPNEKKNIIHGALFLQDNLVKSDYGVSKDNFQYFVNALKNDLKTLETRIQQLGEKASADLKNTLHKIEPTIKQLQDSYVDELKKLAKEVSDDKVLKEISEALDIIVKFVASLIQDVIDVTKPFIDKLHQTYTDFTKKVSELYEKEIGPQLKSVYNNLSAALKETLDGLIDVVAHVAAIVADFFEKHKPELEELTNTIAEIFKDLTRLFVAQLKELRVNAAQIFSQITDQIKDMPVIAELKKRIQELAVPDVILGALSEAHQAIRVVLPTEEIKTLSDAIFSYTMRKLRQEKVDDAVELRKIYEKFTVALTSLVQFVKQQLNAIGGANLASLNVMPVFNAPSQSLHSVGGLPAFSLLNLVLHGDIPDPLSLIRAYRPRSLNPLDEVPAKLRAVVVHGQHIFTFDGRHLTFPGSCRYVLAHDYADRNFTLVMQLQAGEPSALLLEDKSGTTVELKANGQVAVNGAVHGFPVDEKDIFAFRAPDGRLGLGTTYGLMAICSEKLEVCYIEVNGFYLGKLRGLLGDGNNEPYDDFRLPNGKIVTSESEFGNAYRLSSSCAQVKTPEHHHEQFHARLTGACDKVFGASSTLRPLAPFLDVRPFRQACIHAVGAETDAAKSLQIACDLGRGYAVFAYSGLLPVLLPPACLQCFDTDKPRNIGDTYEIKLPNKQADIVVAVETVKANEATYKTLIVPLVSQLVDGLKNKHIDDIKVYLVGITSKMPYPILYDADHKLKGAKIHFDDESRYQNTKIVHTNNEKVNNAEKYLANLVDSLRLNLGLSNVMHSYGSLTNLPLRPGAIKQFISVTGEKCKSQMFAVDILRTVAYGVYTSENAISQTTVIVTPDLKIGGGKNPNDVIGFDSDHVYLVGEKRSKETADLRQTLEIQPDACIDYAKATGGLVVSSSHFLAAGANQKQFVSGAVAAILHRALSRELQQQCSCTYADPFSARSVCFNEHEQAVARRRK